MNPLLLLFYINYMSIIKNASVIVFGLGGVGGAAAEALVRAGVGKIGIVDKDIVDITNLNRQLIATDETVGMKKTDATEKRLLSINPEVKIVKYDLFYLPENADMVNLSEYDFILDQNWTSVDREDVYYSFDASLNSIPLELTILMQDAITAKQKYSGYYPLEVPENWKNIRFL